MNTNTNKREGPCVFIIGNMNTNKHERPCGPQRGLEHHQVKKCKWGGRINFFYRERALASNRRNPYQESDRLWTPPELEGERLKSILAKGKWSELEPKWKCSARDQWFDLTRKVRCCKPHQIWEGVWSKSILAKIVMQTLPKSWCKMILVDYDNDSYDYNYGPRNTVLKTIKVWRSSIDEDNKRC